jgi:hypothetical protein
VDTEELRGTSKRHSQKGRRVIVRVVEVVGCFEKLVVSLDFEVQVRRRSFAGQLMPGG